MHVVDRKIQHCSPKLPAWRYLLPYVRHYFSDKADPRSNPVKTESASPPLSKRLRNKKRKEEEKKKTLQRSPPLKITRLIIAVIEALWWFKWSLNFLQHDRCSNLALKTPGLFHHQEFLEIWMNDLLLPGSLTGTKHCGVQVHILENS